MSLTAEDIQNIARAMQPQSPPVAQPPAGAITANGIVKYQTIIIVVISSVVAVGGWLVSNTNKATENFVNITRDIDALKKAQEGIVTDAKKTPDRVQIVENDVRDMKNVIEIFKAGQLRTEGKIDDLTSAFNAFKGTVAREVGDLKARGK